MSESSELGVRLVQIAELLRLPRPVLPDTLADPVELIRDARLRLPRDPVELDGNRVRLALALTNHSRSLSTRSGRMTALLTGGLENLHHVIHKLTQVGERLIVDETLAVCL